jgi:hypothetical protein
MDPLRRAFGDLMHHASNLEAQLRSGLAGGIGGGDAAAAERRGAQQQGPWWRQGRSADAGGASALQRLPGMHAARGSTASPGASRGQAAGGGAARRRGGPPARVSFGPPLGSITQGLWGQRRPAPKDGGDSEGGGGGGKGGGGKGGKGGGGKGGKGEDDERILISEVCAGVGGGAGCGGEESGAGPALQGGTGPASGPGLPAVSGPGDRCTSRSVADPRLTGLTGAWPHRKQHRAGPYATLDPLSFAIP